MSVRYSSNRPPYCVLTKNNRSFHSLSLLTNCCMYVTLTSLLLIRQAYTNMSTVAISAVHVNTNCTVHGHWHDIV